MERGVERREEEMSRGGGREDKESGDHPGGVKPAWGEGTACSRSLDQQVRGNTHTQQSASTHTHERTLTHTHTQRKEGRAVAYHSLNKTADDTVTGTLHTHTHTHTHTHA